MDNSNYVLSFLDDLYRIVEVNEQVLYGDNKIFCDKVFFNKAGVVVDDFLDLPSDYISVNKKGEIIKKNTDLLVEQLLTVFGKAQRKFYKADNKFGIKVYDINTSFCEDLGYLCYMYTNNQSSNISFRNWIRNYSADFVFQEPVRM